MTTLLMPSLNRGKTYNAAVGGSEGLILKGQRPRPCPEEMKLPNNGRVTGVLDD